MTRQGSLPSWRCTWSDCGSGRWAGWDRPLAKGEPDHRLDPRAGRRIEGGDPRFWALVTVLADAVQEAWDAALAEARDILLDAARSAWLIGEHPRMARALRRARKGRRTMDLLGRANWIAGVN